MNKLVYNFLIISTISIMVSSCSRNPVTGKKELMLMSQNQEQAMGDQADPSIIQAYGMYDDQKLQDFINEKGKAMGKVSHRPDINYQFRLLDSPVVNAFAVPGGYVYFTRGIMAHFNNEAEFAGVLGHEIGHITARHSAKQQTQQTLGQLGFMVGIVASEKFRVFANEAGQGLGLLFLKFGRDHESQSDELGVEYSTKIGYDSHEMADFFQTLNRLSQGAGHNIPDFLSTHPNPVNRYAKVHEMSEDMQSELGLTNLKVNRAEYLRRIDGLVYGEDPKQGYVDGGTFYHPELKFQFPVPSDWQLVNSPAQVQMAPQDGKAMMIFTLSPEKTIDAAAQATVEQFKLNVVESQRTTVHGLSALAMVSDQVPDPQQQQQQQASAIRIITYFINYNNMIYVFHGLSEKNDFSRYMNTFKRTMTNFSKLTDPSKLNVQPTRIKIITVSKTGTLRDILLLNGVPSVDLEELAIVNGMQLDDQIPSGELLKIFSKDHNKQGAGSTDPKKTNYTPNRTTTTQPKTTTKPKATTGTKRTPMKVIKKGN